MSSVGSLAQCCKMLCAALLVLLVLLCSADAYHIRVFAYSAARLLNGATL